MTQQSLGLIETIGLVAAIRAADTAVKAANVQLIGYEFAKGGGMTVVKVCGDVGAVKAAVAAATAEVDRFVSATVIARPAKGLAAFVASRETVGNPVACNPAKGDGAAGHEPGSDAPEAMRTPVPAPAPVAEDTGAEAPVPARAERTVLPMEAQAELPAASVPPAEPEPRTEPEPPAVPAVDEIPKTVAAPARPSGPAGPGSRKGKRKGGQ